MICCGLFLRLLYGPGRIKHVWNVCHEILPLHWSCRRINTWLYVDLIRFSTDRVRVTVGQKVRAYRSFCLGRHTKNSQTVVFVTGLTLTAVCERF